MEGGRRERVVKVGVLDGERVVITMRGSTRTTYRGVSERVRVGDELSRPPRHHTRSIAYNWSAWGDEDDDVSTGRRRF